MFEIEDAATAVIGVDGTMILAIFVRPLQR